MAAEISRLATIFVLRVNCTEKKEQTLRDERHLAWLALKNQSPRFETTDEAEAKALEYLRDNTQVIEIEGSTSIIIANF